MQRAKQHWSLYANRSIVFMDKIRIMLVGDPLFDRIATLMPQEKVTDVSKPGDDTRFTPELR